MCNDQDLNRIHGGMSAFASNSASECKCKYKYKLFFLIIYYKDQAYAGVCKTICCEFGRAAARPGTHAPGGRRVSSGRNQRLRGGDGGVHQQPGQGVTLLFAVVREAGRVALLDRDEHQTGLICAVFQSQDFLQSHPFVDHALAARNEEKKTQGNDG